MRFKSMNEDINLLKQKLGLADELVPDFAEYFAYDDEEPRGVDSTTPVKLQLAGGHFDMQELLDAGYTVEMKLMATMVAQPGETVSIEVHGEVDDTSAGAVPGLSLSSTSTTPVTLSTDWVDIGAFYAGTIVPASGSLWEHDIYGFRSDLIGGPPPVFVQGASLWVRASK